MEDAQPVRFRSYPSRTRADVQDSSRIWEIARATCAATDFFDPIKIGRFGDGFADAGAGTNNPIRVVWNEAKHTFLHSAQLPEGHIRCLISIGPGRPSLRAFGGNLQTVATALVRMAADAQHTADLFHSARLQLIHSQQYFRFNVDQGLQGIGLEHSGRAAEIMAATRQYLESEFLALQMQQCARRLGDGRRGSEAPVLLTRTPQIPRRNRCQVG